MTLDELFKGKAYQRGNALYPTTEEIVLPFVRQVEEYASDFRIQVQKPSDIAVNVIQKGDSTEIEEFNIYSRVSVEAILKEEYQFDAVNDRYAKTIGLVYALDKQQPEVITYSGYLKQLCLNMTIFNSSAILRKNFNDPDFDNIYHQAPIFINKIEGEKQEYIDVIRDIVAGNINIDSSYSADIVVAKKIQEKFIEKSKAEKDFCDEFESEEKYNLVNLTTNQNTDLLFFRPVKGIITQKFNSRKKLIS